MKNYVFVPLEKHRNHKIISRSNQGGLDNSGVEFAIPIHDGLDYFNPESFPESGCQLKSNDGIPFYLDEISDEKYDNISCSLQEIQVSSSPYSFLNILGFCEWNNIRDTFTINFKDGSCEKVSVFLYDWLKGHAVWTFEQESSSKVFSELKNNYGESRYLYNTRIPINESCNCVSSITLPYDPSMHIIAITMECGE